MSPKLGHGKWKITNNMKFYVSRTKKMMCHEEDELVITI